MKSWVSSAFDNASSVPSSKAAKRETKKPTALTEKGRMNANDIDIEILHSPRLNKENTTQRFTSQSKKANNTKSSTGQTLCDKYEPTNRSDLVVNKAKVDQLSNILDDLIKKPKGSILVIEGPSGSGKNVTN
jgi:hypothetical protein